VSLVEDGDGRRRGPDRPRPIRNWGCEAQHVVGNTTASAARSVGVRRGPGGSSCPPARRGEQPVEVGTVAVLGRAVSQYRSLRVGVSTPRRTRGRRGRSAQRLPDRGEQDKAGVRNRAEPGPGPVGPATGSRSKRLWTGVPLRPGPRDRGGSASRPSRAANGIRGGKSSETARRGACQGRSGGAGTKWSPGRGKPRDRRPRRSRPAGAGAGSTRVSPHHRLAPATSGAVAFGSVGDRRPLPATVSRGATSVDAYRDARHREPSR